MWSEQHPKRFSLIFDTLFKLFTGNTIILYYREYHLLKIGTQCVHVASQKKHQLTKTGFLLQAQDNQCNIIYIFTIPTMQLLDLV